MRKLNAKNQSPNSKDVKVIRSLLNPFRDRQADIVANRGNVTVVSLFKPEIDRQILWLMEMLYAVKKRSPRVHLILGRLHTKNQGPLSRDKKYISLSRKL